MTKQIYLGKYKGTSRRTPLAKVFFKLLYSNFPIHRFA